MTDAYRIITAVTAALASAFYDVTHLRPAGVSPRIAGPAIVVANHPNSVLDPVLVASSTTTKLRFLAKAPLFSSRIIGPLVRGAGALPVYRSQDGANTADNASTFDKVNEALVDGGVVAIFPEGRSIDTTELLELKTGAARMVIAALDAGVPTIDVIPVGIWFADKTRFRTDAATMRGPILAVENGSTDVPGLTRQIDEALRSVTVNTGTSTDLALALNLADFTQTPRDRHATIVADQARFVSRSTSEQIERLDSCFRRADWLGANARELGDLRAVGSHAVAIDLAVTAALMPAAVVGVVGAAPAFYATDRIARRFIKTPTDESMMKIGVGALLYPLWGWLLHRLLRVLGRSSPQAASSVLVIWILHLAARPTLGAIRQRWSARRLRRRMDSVPTLVPELDRLAAEIRSIIR